MGPKDIASMLESYGVIGADALAVFLSVQFNAYAETAIRVALARETSMRPVDIENATRKTLSLLNGGEKQ